MIARPPERVYPAVPQLRRRLPLALGAVSVLGLGALLWLERALASAGDDPGRLLAVVTVVVAALAVLAGGTGAFLARLGLRTLRHGQFPPPGTLVVRDVPLRTGRRARLLGWTAIACAAVMLACALFFPLWLVAVHRLAGAPG